ncbi:MAG: hypothetical protein HC860_20330 [Alkalinema sp. RU_4_3]|nr:hypothetical protein [Alkalinema sp. RU_4_3]
MESSLQKERSAGAVLRVGDRKSILRRIWLLLWGCLGFGGDRPGLSSGGDRSTETDLADSQLGGDGSAVGAIDCRWVF